MQLYFYFDLGHHLIHRLFESHHHHRQQTQIGKVNELLFTLWFLNKAQAHLYCKQQHLLICSFHFGSGHHLIRRLLLSHHHHRQQTKKGKLNELAFTL